MILFSNPLRVALWLMKTRAYDSLWYTKNTLEKMEKVRRGFYYQELTRIGNSYTPYHLITRIVGEHKGDY